MCKQRCDECIHQKGEAGDFWSPPSCWCELDLEDENGDCEEYEYFNYLAYQQEEYDRKHDAQLRGFDWREARGDYD